MTITNDSSSSSHSYGGDDWRIWQTIQKLEEGLLESSDASCSNSKMIFLYPEITTKVIDILKEWANNWSGQIGWMHLLNKSSLYHEIEESIVALHYLLIHDAAPPQQKQKLFIVLDICAGKGLFSFLLSYFKHPLISKIILLEKDNKINWNHIKVGNMTAKKEGRPIIEIWSDQNLHDYDIVLDRILELPVDVALSGIHLCKQLSPSFIGIVNGLGSKCIYASLMPCCMPTAVTSQKTSGKKKKKKSRKFSLSIQLEESSEERSVRKDYMIRRERLRRKPKDGPCFYCCDPIHNLRDCPILPTLPTEEQISIRQGWHKATVPCWNCLEFGHYKNECPKIINDTSSTVKVIKCSSSHNSMMPPTIELDVSGILETNRPYMTYCQLISTSFQMKSHNKSIEVIETQLEKSSAGHQEKHNWNNERKSICIVVK